ncbi:hypothetical protein NDU88_007331 [Pleurodeles waltl]|uniref:Uncharacterized protein n=1 Tax=Pleurodeles waltl TaxID=8319 RepID=A0AAV7QMN9_PLEWA|nr:hypothetical protein NDU88_007331 [Pleurodeles waltl]
MRVRKRGEAVQRTTKASKRRQDEWQHDNGSRRRNNQLRHLCSGCKPANRACATVRRTIYVHRLRSRDATCADSALRIYNLRGISMASVVRAVFYTTKQMLLGRCHSLSRIIPRAALYS